MAAAGLAFFVPSAGLVADAPSSIDDYWAWIHGAVAAAPALLPDEGVPCTWLGPYNWTIQTFLYLRAAGVACALTAEMPESGIVIAHGDFLPRRLQPLASRFVVEIKPDRALRSTRAQFVIVQSRHDPILRGADRDAVPSAVVPYWPQPGLLPRDSARGDRFDHIAYMGNADQLTADVDILAAGVRARGLQWSVMPRERWHDYRNVDAVVALRRSVASIDPTRDSNAFSPIRKPASKLCNAWLAGVPAVLSPDIAFRDLRRSPLDYLEASSVADALTHIDRLKLDVGLRRAMVENGRRRALDHTAARATAAWLQLLEEEVRPRYAEWQRAAGSPTQAPEACAGAARPHVGNPAGLDADVVVFGSGFAAYEVARWALRRGRTCVVIERGDRDPDRSDPALSRVPFAREPITSGGFDFGARVPAGFDGVPRYVGVGGTSQLWSGKWRRLDHVDLSREIAGRQWPISSEEMDGIYDTVAADYGWPDWSSDPVDDARREVERRDLRWIDIYEEQPPLRLLDRWHLLEETGRLRLLDRSHLVGVDGTGGSLDTIRIHRDEGELAVAARSFVVACGGIESVRVAHTLRMARAEAGIVPVAYGGFVDHPKAFIGEVTAGPRQRWLIDRLQASRAGGQRVVGFGLPEDETSDSGLGNHTIFLWPGAQADGPLRMVINLEQLPEPGNFVEPDDNGRVSWRMSGRTWADFSRFTSALAPRLEALLGGSVRLDPHPQFRGASHHACALPIGVDGTPLDEHGRLREVANVYCVSSAIFPLAGSANPTMTVVGLAKRLADHLWSSA